MDTRRKILSLEEARRLPRGEIVLVSGTFNPLLAAHARALACVRNRTSGRRVLVAVLPGVPPLLPQRARAELVAAMRVIDYVVVAEQEHVEELIGTLAPLETVRLEADDAIRTGQLIEHVLRRQTR